MLTEETTQAEIVRTLSEQQTDVAMEQLLQELKQTQRGSGNAIPASAIRAALLTLISLRRVELTEERKLRLAR